MTALNPRRARWALAIAVAALATLALAGLPGASAGETARASRANKVDIANFAYHPRKLTIRAGSKVVFTNSSGVAHTATRAGAFDTGQIGPGGSAVVRFKRKGIFAYHCTIHPFMHGKIVVK